MKIWLDDLRTPPDESWTWAKTAQEAKELLELGTVEEISLDHDLGNWETGYTVAIFIEVLAYQAGMKPPKWAVHSANPVGRDKIVVALQSAERAYARR